MSHTGIITTSEVSRPATQRKIEALALKLRRRHLLGSREVALEVIRLVKDIVAGARFSSFGQLKEHIVQVGDLLQDAGPKELVVTNMTKRICALLSEEYATALNNFLSTELNSPMNPQSAMLTPALVPETPGSYATERDDPFGTPKGGNAMALGSILDLLGHRTKLLAGGGLATVVGVTGGPSSTLSTPQASYPSSPQTSPSSSQILQKPSIAVKSPTIPSAHVTTMLQEGFSKRSFTLKPVLIEAIQELLDEVELTYRSVGEQSIDHIHSGEFILTLGFSRTVEAFLKAAARKRKFTVIVAETAPSFSGRTMALQLSASNINTILIPDSNIFALLPRCSKVLLGPHLVLADGALLSIAGSLPLCLAANRMRVPVVVVGGMFKFSPLYLGEADWGMRDLGSPEEVLKESEMIDGTSEMAETEVLNPYNDIVPADLVSLYITNL